MLDKYLNVRYCTDIFPECMVCRYRNSDYDNPHCCKCNNGSHVNIVVKRKNRIKFKGDK